VEAMGIRPLITNTIMRGVRERKALARFVARELGIESDIRHSAGESPG
jgi:hypothetical protein